MLEYIHTYVYKYVYMCVSVFASNLVHFVYSICIIVQILTPKKKTLHENHFLCNMTQA